MTMIQWLQAHETISFWLAAISLVSFGVTLAVVPWVVVRIPADYFVGRKRPEQRQLALRSPVVWLGLLIVKNTIGALLVLAGLAMLVLPGQGLLTMIIGVLVMNFPGKFAFERWLVSRGPTLSLINRIRRRYGRSPLVLSGEDEAADRADVIRP
ncbi:Putative transmembrane protein (PGPGW) [Desulfofustis glycolicus DSM 9705]|uniref:Putative transmembrane protein (PGPGW) n=2 Tax=Desulfofustis glycolicus TaxID=51195 RepID=A0A1M5SIQ0_9BACT|nr:Putative transmembrane protein (PGPGW) [Desulfofustis glycolicus DSM 9705]